MPRAVLVGTLVVAALMTGVALSPRQLSAAAAQNPPQAPTFRAAVDLVAVDVQVVDDEGAPIANLGPEHFEVSIGGKRRRVVSADFIRTSTLDGRPFEAARGSTATGGNIWPTSLDPRAGRIYVLAFDISSLAVGDSRAVAASAATFIDRLQPSDLVGLYTFPIGQLIEPTENHAAVRSALDTVVGSTAQGFLSKFNLSPAEIVDINAELARNGGGVLQEVAERECPEFGSGCIDQILNEAQSLAYYLEGRATETLHGLRRMIDVLSDFPGRKAVVLFSSGMPTSDRAGGRPDVGDLPRTLGQDAAAANASIYTIFVDTASQRSMSAETRRLVGTPASRSRDRAINNRIMEEFTGGSGGAFLSLVTGSGEYALNRVLRETSSHYLLGVEPDPADRDGTLRPLRVKVNHDDVTVRSRMWVVVPKAGE